MAGSKPVQFSVKTVVIGDSQVGKTSVLGRFTRDFFDEGSQPTLGVEFVSRALDTAKHRHVEIQLWDTAGQETFRAVTRGYYRGATAAYVVFDLSREESFRSLERWVSDVRDVVQTNLILVLIGNKSDLADREVTEAQGRAFAAEKNMKYFEVSAKTGANVMEAITSILPDIDKMADDGLFQAPSPVDSIVYEGGDGESKCC